MLYKFKSQAEGDVVMLAANGDQMLTLIGKQPSAQGVITVDQMPAAIAALEAAIVQSEAAEAQSAEPGAAQAALHGDRVRLRARAAPFIELLRNSARADEDVVWGV